MSDSTGLPFYLANPNDPTAQTHVDPSTVPSNLDPSVNPWAKSWGFDQGLAQGYIGAGPQFALNANNQDSILGQIAQQQASQTAQAGYLNQDYQTGLAKLGLQGEQIGVQQGANARQPAYLSTLHDLANQAYWQQADQALRGLNSAATARGAYTAIGTNQGRQDIANQLANQVSRSDTQYNEQMASVQDQNKMLDIQARDLGLSRDQLKNQLQMGLDRLGLSTYMNVQDLTQRMNSSKIEDQVLAQQIWNSALQNSDFYSQYWTPPPVNSGSTFDQRTIYSGRL